MDIHIPVAFFLGTAVAASAATGLAYWRLKQREILDVPGERSSHVRPTVTGGGLGLIPVLIIAWLAIVKLTDTAGLAAHVPVLGAALLLGVLSWIDDARGLSQSVRLLAHFIAVGVILAVSGSGLYFQGLLPAWLDIILAAVLWVWFINLFNFMDGIDGLSSAETSAIGFGLFILSAIGAVGATQGLIGLVLAGAVIGFLVWNWPPARLFMGDVGSIPLGFLIGWLLLGLAADGHWAAAVILPFYYFADATLTIIRRLIRGVNIFAAHREHFYQRAVQRGLTHGQTDAIVLGGNVLLIGLAVYSTAQAVIALICAALVAVIVLGLLRGPLAAE